MYLPFEDRPFRHRIGARPLTMDEWLDVSGPFTEELDLKTQLLTTRHAEVFASLDDRALDEGAEVLSLIQHHLRTYHPECVSVIDKQGDLHPLDHAGRLVAEDLCIMGTRNGKLVLTAATLCFPNRWRLADKLGHSMLDIHQPVARYEQDIGAATDSFLERLSVDKPVWRANWGVVDDPTLFQPTGHGRSDAQRCDPASLFLRVERQALIRLPATNAVLFSIHTYVSPLPEAVTSIDDRFRLAAAIERLPPDVLTYKSMTSFAADVVAWLRDLPSMS